MNRPAPPSSPHHPDAPGPSGGGEEAHRPDKGGARVVVTAFAISLAVHVALIVLYPIVMDRTDPDALETDPEDRPAPERIMEMITLREIGVPPDVAEEEEVEEVPEEIVVPAPAIPALPDPAAEEEVVEVEPEEPEAAPRRLSPAEMLRPRMGHEDFWRLVDPSVLELTEHERAEIAIRLLLQEVGDSLTAEEARRLEALDWTYTDDDGGRWGVSPGKLHLGDRTIPIPFEFMAPPGLRDAQAQRAWEDWDIERAAALSAARETWRDRIQEIRRRRDAERADTTGNNR